MNGGYGPIDEQVARIKSAKTGPIAKTATEPNRPAINTWVINNKQVLMVTMYRWGWRPAFKNLDEAMSVYVGRIDKIIAKLQGSEAIDVQAGYPDAFGAALVSAGWNQSTNHAKSVRRSRARAGAHGGHPASRCLAASRVQRHSARAPPRDTHRARQ